jgi:hypothetical protein
MAKEFGFDEKFVLEKGGMAKIGDGLEIYLTEIHFGENETGGVGAGEAFKVTLDLKKDDDVKVADMNTLHEGYGNRSIIEWKHYDVELLNVVDNRAELTVRKTRDYLEAPEGWENNDDDDMGGDD